RGRVTVRQMVCTAHAISTTPISGPSRLAKLNQNMARVYRHRPVPPPTLPAVRSPRRTPAHRPPPRRTRRTPMRITLPLLALALLAAPALGQAKTKAQPRAAETRSLIPDK